MPRFVILEHDHPALHWDFMLEAGPALRTWRLAAPPAPGITVAAEPLPDHRPAYLDYEGPVSGNRGTVMRWDGGTFAWEEDGDGRVAVRLEGRKVRGRAVLARGAAGEWALRLEAEG